MNCVYCGARYAMLVRRSPNINTPAEVNHTQMSRREWHDYVLKCWTDWGHDAELLKKLAAGDKAPFEPIERKGDDDERSKAGIRGAGKPTGKGKAQSRPNHRRPEEGNADPAG